MTCLDMSCTNSSMDKVIEQECKNERNNFNKLIFTSVKTKQEETSLAKRGL